MRLHPRTSWEQYEAEVEETNLRHKQAVAAMVKRDYPLTKSQLVARNFLVFLGGVAFTVVVAWVFVSMWLQIPF